MSSNLNRRKFLGTTAAACGAVGLLPSILSGADAKKVGVSVKDLPPLKGDLTLYLGRGEGGLYEKVLDAVKKRNPGLNLSIRRGPTAALANTIVAEAKMGVLRADVFWAVDSGALGLVAETGKAVKLPPAVTSQVDKRFRYDNWVPVSGRIRTVPFNTKRMTAEKVPEHIMALPDSNLKIGWAPAYGAFQSFVTAMRLLEGEKVTRVWLKGVQKRAKNYAGELSAVMAASRGEVDIALANHYYTLRLKAGDPDAKVDLAFTKKDAGCLLNASGAMALKGGDLATNFIRSLLTREVQSFLSDEAYEIPMISGAETPKGLPPLDKLQPPEVDLAKLADLRPTLDLMREVGVL